MVNFKKHLTKALSVLAIVGFALSLVWVYISLQGSQPSQAPTLFITR